MKNIKLEFENCYGINKLEKEFDFSTGKVYAVYARNGLMKTSFAKTFKMIQDGKSSEVKDEIFNKTPNILKVEVDNSNISCDDIFVIKSFENSYESDNIASLLINSDLKKSINSVLNLRNNFLKLLEKQSGLKVQKTSQGKKVYEMENTLIKDFKCDDSSFLLNLKKFDLTKLADNLKDIKYSSIFDEAVLKKIKSETFQKNIKEFIKKSDEMYNDFNFLDKGRFTLPKLKEISKDLEKNNYFVKDNKIILAGDMEITNIKQISDKLKEIDDLLKDLPELKEIEKSLSDAKGIVLKDIIENNPSIVEMLLIDNLNELRLQLWLSYIKLEEKKFEELKKEYESLEKKIDEINFDETPWKRALEIFEKRFTVPYKMKIVNLKSSIIGESLPKIIFSFCKDGNKENLDPENWVEFDRDELENKDVLSQGEKRALYLLNIIFDVEKRKIDNQRTLFIIDDIADSFDYKNKYAIVEYLYEMSKYNNFYLIILSHNFDFYRTISTRIFIPRDKRLNANITNGIISLDKEKYQKQPFQFWKKNLNIKYIIALLPFVRNLIEYGVDKGVNNYTLIDEDYMFLTNLLHVKEHTDKLTFGMLKIIYNEYIGNSNFINVVDTDIVFDKILAEANTINITNLYLENKIILAIATRLTAEKFMIEEINKDVNKIFSWSKDNSIVTGNNTLLMQHVSLCDKQTRELFNGYIQIGSIDKIKVLEKVNIVTPENIHLNSFMYEPILDMDIIELKNIYDDVKKL
ncbi:MAG: hypothetical protein PHR25_03300 [Clostridia bacterium]|nr:hypothetical protein [Clostridia bacterium]MDD4375787.1 hypothetical protein [Clostridia bacterium]